MNNNLQLFLILNYFYLLSFYLLTLSFVDSILSVHLLFWSHIIKMTSYNFALFFNFFFLKISRIINIKINSYKTLNVSTHRVDTYYIYFINFISFYFRFIIFDFFNFFNFVLFITQIWYHFDIMISEPDTL